MNRAVPHVHGDYKEITGFTVRIFYYTHIQSTEVEAKEGGGKRVTSSKFCFKRGQRRRYRGFTTRKNHSVPQLQWRTIYGSRHTIGERRRKKKKMSDNKSPCQETAREQKEQSLDSDKPCAWVKVGSNAIKNGRNRQGKRTLGENQKQVFSGERATNPEMYGMIVQERGILNFPGCEERKKNNLYQHQAKK